jgi:hypothetical protein
MMWFPWLAALAVLGWCSRFFCDILYALLGSVFSLLFHRFVCPVGGGYAEPAYSIVLLYRLSVVAWIHADWGGMLFGWLPLWPRQNCRYNCITGSPPLASKAGLHPIKTYKD